MTKKDYYHDPNAPIANSIVVAVAAIVRNDAGDVLMIERTDNGMWALPGGAQDIGETVIAAVRREVREETGIDIEVAELSGIYSNPAHVIAYDDGEVRQEFSIAFRARPTGGKPRPSSESRQVHWVPRSRLVELRIHPSMLLRIEHGLDESRDRPYVD